MSDFIFFANRGLKQKKNKLKIKTDEYISTNCFHDVVALFQF